VDTVQAFAMGEMNRGKTQMIFDWHKAARFIKEWEAKEASAGLRDDWEWTGGEIWKDGQPVPKEETYTYLASTWAVPEIEIDGQLIECWIYADQTEWDSGTYWPESALKIVRGEED
jgi:hypothetical protein